jgi:hypothetical protein
MNAPLRVEPGQVGRAWFAARFGDFVELNEAQIVGTLSQALAEAGFVSQLADQTLAWGQQLGLLKRLANSLVVVLSVATGQWLLNTRYPVEANGSMPCF